MSESTLATRFSAAAWQVRESGAYHGQPLRHGTKQEGRTASKKAGQQAKDSTQRSQRRKDRKADRAPQGQARSSARGMLREGSHGLRAAPHAAARSVKIPCFWEPTVGRLTALDPGDLCLLCDLCAFALNLACLRPVLMLSPLTGPILPLSAGV